VLQACRSRRGASPSCSRRRTSKVDVGRVSKHRRPAMAAAAAPGARVLIRRWQRRIWG
jgi:hypothetical protein